VEVKRLDKKIVGSVLVVTIVLISTTIYILAWHGDGTRDHRYAQMTSEASITLPRPRYDSEISIEEALLRRRSVREYTGEPLSLQELSQLLWATQGITGPRGLRTAPSAGALYPLEIYVVVGNVEGLDVGVYKYRPHEHSIQKVLEGDSRSVLAEAALGQSWVGRAAVDIVITAVYERTTGKYGERGVRYVHMEVGHAAQNLCLQATALDLGAVAVGAFHDEKVEETLNLPEEEKPLYIIAVGRRGASTSGSAD